MGHEGLLRKQILYITERCVFRLVADGLELIEIAPGIDLQRDILSHMAFCPRIATDLRLMDGRIFQAEAMGLRDIMLEVPLQHRLRYDQTKNTLFINFEGYNVRNLSYVESVRQQVVHALQGTPEKVHAVINYDNFSILPDVIDPYVKMVKDLNQNYYQTVTRYSTSGFLRAKLGGKRA